MQQIKLSCNSIRIFGLLIVLSILTTPALATQFSVSVIVKDCKNNSVSNATVEVFNETFKVSKITNESGVANFLLFTGNYTINVSFELSSAQKTVNVTQNSTLVLTLNFTRITVLVTDVYGNPVENATIKAGGVKKYTNESGIATLNASEVGFYVVASKSGYLPKKVFVNNSTVTIKLKRDVITFYLGTEYNYATLKELENETSFVEVYKLGDFVDFANKTLIFLANVNKSISRFVENSTQAPIASFNSSTGYSDENISRYWVYGGKENLLNLINYLRSKILGINATYEPPKLPSNRSNVMFILDADLSQVPLIEKAAKDLFIERNLNVTVLTYSDQHDIERKIESVNLSRYKVIFLYMLSYPVQDALKDYLLPIKNETWIVGLAFTDVHNITNVNLSDPYYADIKKYWEYGGTENFRRLMIFIGVRLCNISVKDFGISSIPAPVKIPPFGIYHPDARKSGEGYMGMGIFLSVDDYLKWYKKVGKWKDNAPTVGIHYYYVNKQPVYPVIDALITKLEHYGANVIFTSFSYKDKNSSKYLFDNTGKPRVDVLITLTSFRLWYHNEDEGIKYLKKLNVTPIKAIMEYYYNISQWESKTGLHPSSIAWQIALPELDGFTEFILVGAKNKTTKVYEPVDYQIDWLARRAIKWAILHKKPNSEKRIVIIYYNHGGGKDNIGASYLNVPESLEILLKAMKDRGYNVSLNINKSQLLYLLTHQGINIGTWKKDELKKLIKSAVLIPAKKYETWFNELPEKKRKEVIDMWGPPPGDVMVYENESGKYIVLPIIKLGNIVLAPQPTRGYLQDQKALYHDKSLPPHHQYIAFYFWLSKEFKADAIVHFGTHGTQEWLPGKETGLSAVNCWPAILIQDIPVIYPYIMDNVGEGSQAKRRGQAVIVDHLTPPLVYSGLYGNLSLLHEKIHEYFQAQDENVKKELRRTIHELYKELEIDKALGELPTSKSSFDSFLRNKLHEYLHELSNTLMPYGLHTLGVVEKEQIIEFIRAMLGEDFKKHVSKIRNVSEPEDEKILYELIKEVVIDGKSPEQAQISILNATDINVTSDLKTALKYYYDLLNCSREVSQILNALEGKYIPPKIGGDPVRKPEALPTGNNFYSFDPRTIPTKEAWRVAVKLVDDLLRNYYENNGRFPEKISYVLWATETMRNYGVMQAAVLYTIGAKPVWDSRGRVKDVKLIPLENLTLTLTNGSTINRPRIDVVVVSSGLHRDTFSRLMLMLDKAIKLAIGANESIEMNYLKKHCLKIKQSLIKNGYNESVAETLSKIRIFSESPGNYGTGLPNAISASNTWKDESKLAELFIDRVGYAYGEDLWGEAAAEIFRINLKDVDIAVHSRSTNLYATLDNDDFYQYLGGIILAVRHLSGSNPEAFVFNLRNQENAKVQRLQEFIRTELLTRYYNPKWMKGMIEEGYAGAREIAKIIENLWGWEVVYPELISDKDWQNFYEIYVKDKYELGIKKFFEKNNPYALQSIAARMLEAIRKGYWKAPDDIKIELAKEFERLQQLYGFTCCHHTCGNLDLLKYKAGILSSLKTKKESSERRLEISYTGGGGFVITPTPTKTVQKQKRNETTSEKFNQTEEVGSSTEGAGFETKKEKPPEKPLKKSEERKEVIGRKVEITEKKISAPTISVTPVVALLFVLLTAAVFYIGFKRKF